MANNYSLKDYNKENMARAIGRALPISFKQSIEICKFIRNKNVNYAKNILNKVIEQKHAVPYTRFSSDIGHKKNIAAGRYPKKASMEILGLINNAEANAQFKGLNTANLVITHINANKAGKVMRFGRKRSREAKRTSVEIVVQERADKKSEKKESKEVKSDKKETGKEVKSQESKKVVEKQETNTAKKGENKVK